MLSAEKKFKCISFSLQNYSRLQNLLSSKSHSEHVIHKPANNHDNDFIDITLNADFNKEGKIISLS